MLKSSVEIRESICEGFDLRGKHEFEKSRMARSWSAGSHAWWRDSRRRFEGRRRRRRGEKATAGPTLPLSAMPSFSVRRSLRALRATQHWQVISCTQLPALLELPGRRPQSVSHLLFKSILPVLPPASPARPSVTSYDRLSCARVCEHTRLRDTRNFPMLKSIHDWRSPFQTLFLS